MEENIDDEGDKINHQINEVKLAKKHSFE